MYVYILVSEVRFNIGALIIRIGVLGPIILYL